MEIFQHFQTSENITHYESTWAFINESGLPAEQLNDYPANQLKRYWQLLDHRWENGETFITQQMDVLNLPPFMKSAQASYLSVYQVVGILSANEMMVEDIFTQERKKVWTSEGELHLPWTLLITRHENLE